MKSTLAIDLGGRYTGVVSYTSEFGLPSADSLKAYVINTPNNDELTVSVKSRTQVRHRLRSQKRFKLARQLMTLIVQHKVARNLSNSEKEALFGLLKRRGYSRYDSELDLSCLQSIETEPFQSFIPEISEDESLLTQWESFKAGYSTGNVDCINIVRSFASLPDAKQFKEHLKQYSLSKEEVKDYLTALSVLREDALLVEQQSLFGHKHRTQFFDDIYGDIPKDSRLKTIVNDFGGLEPFYRTIGNICNLQLRALRWYFNDPSMKNPYYDDKRLKSVLSRAYHFFHYPKGELEKCRDILSAIESADSALAFLASFDPKKTIPPYEDQNNRKPPLDQTLLLNPRALDLRYGSRWELWVNNLLRAPQSKGIDDQLDVILASTDRKSRLQERQSGQIVHYTSKKLYNAYVLHRLLDRTLDNDPYSLRLISKERIGQSNDIHEAMSRLTKDLGSQHLKEFLEFARNYYNEVELAKRGLWSIVQTPLLERADIHPPMKKGTIISRLINNVLCTENVSISQFWHLRVKGTSTVKSICASIERTRKEYGNFFNAEYKKALAKHRVKEKLDAQDKEFIKIADNVQLTSQRIAQALNLSEEQREKFANPFSLAQLYTIIETEPNGFIKTSVAVNDENAWRTNLAGHARCVRLCSDTVRPFDGAVKKTLERQAYELAKLKFSELQNSVKNDCTVDVTLLIESNEFAFTSSMAEIKKSDKAKAIRNKADRAMKRQDQRWQNKNNRIKTASRGLCPYTGQPLGDNGEIDHIVSRSASLMLYGDILNSEPNLIYCSQKGNQLKSNRIKTIQDLASNYLEKVFGTSNFSAVEELICSTVSRLSDNDIVQFDSLTQQEQDAVRHSLFLNSANPVNRRVRQALAKQFKSRVNGTQAWFARQFIKTLQELSANWCKTNNISLTFDVYRLPSQSVQSDYRAKIATSAPELAKPDSAQPIGSHAIDALCVFGAALDNQKIAKRMGLDNLTLSDSLEHLTALLPQSVDIINIKRKSLFDKDDLQSISWFKETIYAEEFLPIMVKKDETRIGFSWNDQYSLKVKHGDILIKTLSSFLNEAKPVREYEIQTFTINREKAFELLHKVFTAPCTSEECQIADLLEGMSYVTQKTPISDFFDEKSRSFKLNKADKLFSIKIKLDRRFGASGTIFLPCQKDWENEIKKINQFTGQLSNSQNGQDVVLSMKKNLKRSALKHRRTRRVWSMPIVPSGLSAAIRLNRKSHDGRDIYQLQMIKNAKYKGLCVDNEGQIDWNQLLVADIYKQNSLTLRAERYLDSQKFISMDHWLDIDIGIPEVKVRMSPGEANRRHICITQSRQQFENWIGCTLGSMWTMPATKELNEEELANFIKNANSPILGSPRRGVIKFARLGETITYYYCSQSANAQMKNAYQKAYLASLAK